MLSLFASAVTFLGGAKRWLRKETAAALGSVLGAALLAGLVVLGGYMIYGAGKNGAEARVNWRWMYRIAQTNKKAAEEDAARAQRVLEVTQTELTKAQQELRDAQEARVELERELADMKDNPILYTRDERRRLFKR